MQPCVEIRSLGRRLGGRSDLRDIDLVLAPGQVHGLLGPRGAGKTTLLRVLAGDLAASSGSARLPARVVLVGDDGLSPIEERLTPGTRRRVALARAVASAPDLLLVDEPVEGFDPDTAATTRSLVLQLAAQGGAVVWATRRLDSIAGVAGHVTLLAHGRARYSGSLEALADRALAGLSTGLAASLGRAA
jgi:ABC-type multidrug transport system ATPase subunit